ncbi:MAG: hypothetical protein QOE74_2311 [Mycobacterium sp.]|jgi:Na+-driven multidrug efflux pump|nr:hypothetical protein [Mycobacterium sp.]
MSELNGGACELQPADDRARRARRIRFWAESLVAGAALLLALLTLVWRDWIEEIFGVDPDNRSGGLEWIIVVGLLVVAAALAVTARVEWRRLRPALDQGPG